MKAIAEQGIKWGLVAWVYPLWWQGNPIATNVAVFGLCALALFLLFTHLFLMTAITYAEQNGIRKPIANISVHPAIRWSGRIWLAVSVVVAAALGHFVVAALLVAVAPVGLISRWVYEDYQKKAAQ